MAGGGWSYHDSLTPSTFNEQKQVVVFCRLKCIKHLRMIGDATKRVWCWKPIMLYDSSSFDTHKTGRKCLAIPMQNSCILHINLEHQVAFKRLLIIRASCLGFGTFPRPTCPSQTNENSSSNNLIKHARHLIIQMLNSTMLKVS